MSWEWNPDNDPNHLDCTKAFHKMADCGSGFHQIRRYHRVGELDSCSESFHELFLCFRLKLTNREKAKQKLEEMYPHKNREEVIEKKSNPLFVYRDEPPLQWRNSNQD